MAGNNVSEQAMTAAVVTIGAVDLGIVQNVDINLNPKWAPFPEGNYPAPGDYAFTGGDPQITMEITQTAYDLLEKIMSWCVRSGSTLTGYRTPGYRASSAAGTLIINPVDTGFKDWTFYSAFAADCAAISFEKGKPVIYKVTFRALADGSRAVNDQVYNNNKTADTTAPTYTISPTSGQANIAVTANITATFTDSGAMDAGSITDAEGGYPAHLHLCRLTGFTELTGAITYDSATKVATFDPGASLTASARYIVTITSGIRDTAGNRITPKTWDFTTAA